MFTYNILVLIIKWKYQNLRPILAPIWLKKMRCSGEKENAFEMQWRKRKKKKIHNNFDRKKMIE